MKLENSKRDFIREGSEETTKMSISADVESHIIKVLTEHSYDDPLGSSIRECVSNAVDSVMEAGTKEPVIVSLQKNKAGQQELTIEDKGLGLDDVSFKKYIMGLGESTKRNNDMLLGGYGAGAKAWLAYTDSFTYTCFKDGIERKYLIFKGEEFPECSLIHEKPTSRVNGVIVTVQLKSSWQEVHNCTKKIKEQLAYLDNVYYNIPDFKNTYKIHRGPCFQFSDLLVNDYTEMHISLKNIRYPIDWSKLGMSSIALPIALRFDDYDSIKPIFNRESIQYNSASIRAIKAKIQEVAEWFGKKWDSEVSEFDNFRKARMSIVNHERPVTVNGKTFDVKDFLKQMNVSTKVPNVKGLKLRSAKFYADLGDSILNRWEAMGLDQNGTWKKAHIKYEYQRCVIDMDDSSWKKCIVVLVNESITGYLKDYLREKYPSKSERVFYVQRNKPFARKIGTVSGTDYTYEGLCKLGGILEDQWQAYIDELELVLSHYEDTFHHELDVKGTQAFLDFVEQRRAQIKAGAKPKPTGAYIALDKQKGEVTVYNARMAKVGDAIVYEKDKEKIEDLNIIGKTNGVVIKPTVYWPTTQDDLDDAFVKPFMGSFNFIRVNQTELKHFQSIKHFMSREKFMEAKPLARLATAILIEQILDLEPNNTDMIDLTSKEMMRVRNKLIEYKKAHLETVAGKLNSKIKDVILQDAKDRGHWDRTIYADAVVYREKLKPYMFLSLLKDTDSWRTSQEEKLAIKNLTYVMLKHNKLTHKQLDQFELVPKVQPMTDDKIYDLQIAVA